MDIDGALLRALNQPGPHSGSRLGETLGISRVAIQKRLASLRDQGLPLEALAGQGYHLEAGVRLLDEQVIRNHLSADTLARVQQIAVLRQVESTNLWMQQQQLQETKASICVAECQTAGRGRRGAGWVSSPYRNLIFSLGWRFPSWPAHLPGLSLVVGLVCAQVLEILEVDRVAIKWPNDIYRGDAKLAGTLVQAGGEASGHCDVVIGVGMNIQLLDADRALVHQSCADLTDLAAIPDRNQIAALLIEALTEVLPLFAEQGFTPFRKAWEARALFLGEPVKVLIDGVEQRGRMLGVDDQGALIFKSDAGKEQRFTEADIRLRAL